MNIISDPGLLDFSRWDHFVNKHPGGNFFQSSTAYSFFKGIKNYDPFVFALAEGESYLGILTGVTISEPGLKSLLTRRSIIWGGPLVSEGSNIYAGMLIEKMRSSLNKSVFIEFRNLHDTTVLEDAFFMNRFRYRAHLNYLVKISSIEENERALSKSKLRQIRSSIKNGAEIIVPESETELKDFYSILAEVYKKRIRKPYPSFEFFFRFYKNPDLGRIFLIRYRSEIIGGIVCPMHNGRTIYEWYIAGLDGRYNGVYPSILATWAPIFYGNKSGFEEFDFLGAGSPDSDYGVREFKSKFGGEQVQHGRYLRINRPLIYYAGKGWLSIKSILK